jgi:hypothetical protein
MRPPDEISGDQYAPAIDALRAGHGIERRAQVAQAAAGVAGLG